MLKLPGFVLIAAFLTGCASVPNVTYKYYPAKWNTTVTVTQTVGCNAAKTEAIVLNAVSVTTAYSSNFEKDPFEIKIRQLDKYSADVDMTMTLTDDGRLKSINQSTTGQGESIIKSAVSLVGSLTALPHMAPFFLEKKAEEARLSQCDDIEKWGDKKPIALIYKAAISSDKLGQEVDLKAASESDKLYEKLKKVLPALKVKVAQANEVKDISSGASYNMAENEDAVLLKLQKIGSVSLSVISSDAEKPIAGSRIIIPRNETYELPIPKAALFGKQSFSVVLSEAGAITSIGYGKTTGVAGALNALGSIATTETAATEAANLKAQSDLIFQQQRYVLCTTKPDQCK